MKRFTQSIDGQNFANVNDIRINNELLSGELINELAMYENVIEKLFNSIDDNNNAIALLCSEGKDHTCHCKELVTNNIVIKTTLALLRAKGLEDKKWRE